ncbi:Sak single strand annealing protein, partial [Staphylococcus epidermidis]|uniref:Sak single strand annealing protein n=1 Tax=Staphylococcus epidermidis TaxID=1282 RepID=UPI0011A80763
TEQTLFNQLNHKHLNHHLQNKNPLTYLPSSYPHQQLNNIHTNYTIKTHQFLHPHLPLHNYFLPYLPTPHPYFLQLSLTLKPQTQTQSLPLFDFRNKSLPNPTPTTFHINKP